MRDSHQRGVLQPPHDHLISAVIGVYEGIEEQRHFGRDPAPILVASLPNPGRFNDVYQAGLTRERLPKP